MAQASAGQGLQTRRVLVVEDEFFIADDIRTALDSAGAEVVGPVATCDEALALIHEQSGRIDLGVLDINLGGELCFPAAEVLARAGVPFIFTTGYQEAMLPPRFRHVTVWEKPFDPFSLVRSLPAVIARQEG